jgi:hypothetical protein
MTIYFYHYALGNVLSDYNGLRLAAHIRCTSSLNQLSRIFVYGIRWYRILD